MSISGMSTAVLSSARQAICAIAMNMRPMGSITRLIRSIFVVAPLMRGYAIVSFEKPGEVAAIVEAVLIGYRLDGCVAGCEHLRCFFQTQLLNDLARCFLIALLE